VRANGFTLIELMIVVAIIGLLSAVALTSYNSYVTTSQAAVVANHYDQAITYTRWEYAAAHALRSQGVVRPEPVPITASGWITLLDTGAGRAPVSGPAYVPGAANAATGAVGIEVTGTFDGADSEVTLHRPSFAGLTAETTVINMDRM